MNTIMIAPAKVEPASKGCLSAFAEEKGNDGKVVRLRIQECREGAKPIYRLLIAEGELAGEIKRNVKINDYLMIIDEEQGYTNKTGQYETFIKLTSFQVIKKTRENEMSITAIA